MRVEEAQRLRIIGVDGKQASNDLLRIKILLHLGHQLAFKETRRVLIDSPHERILLSVAPFLPGFACFVAEKPPVEDKVYVLGEALYEVESLGEARTALEGE